MSQFSPLTEEEFATPPEFASALDEDQILEAELAFNRAVSAQAEQLRIRDAAAHQVKRERRGEHAKPQGFPLPAFLAIPDEESAFRVDGLWPVGGRGILAAQYKAGKSTMVGNLLRSLADGDPFLDQYATHQASRVVLIDNELDPRTLRRWLREQHISNPDAVGIIPLRGKVASFDLLDDATRTEWAQLLQGADVVILDCLRPVLDALGLDENKDAGRFLVAFDALLNEAGVSEAMIVHHMGHNGERSRGDSRILDWPDTTWKLVREDTEDPSSTRFFSAFGRDVDITESKLSFNPLTRRLSIAGGTRREAKADEAIPAILAVLQEHEALSGRGVEELLLKDTEFTRAQIRTALKRAHQQQLTVTYEGPRRAVMHSYRPPETLSAPECADSAPAQSSECASAPIERRTHSLEDKTVRQQNKTAHSNTDPRKTP